MCHSCLVYFVNNANNLVPNALFHGFGVGRVDVPTSKAREKCPGDEVVINNYSSSLNGL